MRLLLGRYLRRPPAAIEFSYNREGRPDLADPAADGLYFNLSHSHQRGVYVFSRRKLCGIDLEFPRERVDFLGIAEFFSEGENAALRRTPPESLPDEFLRLWTGKEAVLKAIGQGLALELSSLEIERRADGLLPRLVQNSASEAAAWRLHELRPWPDCRCTLAYRGADARAIAGFDLGEDRARALINEA